jgi:hypothetical protein
MILLLPVLMPLAVVADAWELRRLARTRCIACGRPIGLAEMHRARDAARAKAAAIVASTLARGFKPRVVVDWEVRCPSCGLAYICPHDMRPRWELVPEL